MRRLGKAAAPALVTFVVTALALLPSVLTLPQHGDEAQYGWSAAYFGGKIARLDLGRGAGDLWLDPGWWPLSWWTITQPMGTRLVYAMALGATGAPTPRDPYLYGYPDYMTEDQLLLPATLLTLRLTATLCAALGLALFALRLGWRGVIAAGLLLAIPHARDDLARAWAEGPLLLGFGLCGAAYGSRWFVPACGLAATFKLTALALWPLAWWRGFGRSLPARAGALAGTFGTWSVLTPSSWFFGGPALLLLMCWTRYLEYAHQRSVLSRTNGEFFLPTRYLWPLELLLALLLVHVLARIWQRTKWAKREIFTL